MRLRHLLFLLAIPTFSFGQADINSNYPFRFPDWLWKDQLRSAFIDSATKTNIDSDIALMNASYKNKNDKEGDSLEYRINKILNNKLSLHDASRGGKVTGSLIKLIIQLDPGFKPEVKKVLLEAIGIFTEVATDDDVIKEAFTNSIEFPAPMPEKYDSSRSNPGSLRKYSDDYAFFLNCRSKPASVMQFKTQLSAALTSTTGDPALLIISSYSGNKWWGGSYYNYFNSTNQRLSKFTPLEGYLYIRLNTDSLPTNHSPAFWASKIAHEILHNLGYWHPDYADPSERDANNIGRKKAFIVAYEYAILKKAKHLRSKGEKPANIP